MQRIPSPAIYSPAPSQPATPADRRHTIPPDDPAVLAEGADPVTGLLTRAALLEVLARRTADSQRAMRPFALILLEFGHPDAAEALEDAALPAVAKVLRMGVRGADIAARLDRCGFAVLMPDPTTAAEAHGLASRLVAMLRQPIQLRDGDMKVPCSVGVALYPSDSRDPAGLLVYAALALGQPPPTDPARRWRGSRNADAERWVA